MFTKLNRVLLASGLAVASAALLSPSAFAAPGTTSSGTVPIQGNVQPYTNIVVSPLGTATFSVSFNTAVVANPVATVAYTTNVIGNWRITAEGGNAGKEGTLVSGDTTATIPYTLSLAGGAGVQPGASGNTSQILKDGSVPANGPITEVTASSLTIDITAPNTKVPTAPTSAYTEIVTLVFTSDLP